MIRLTRLIAVCSTLLAMHAADARQQARYPEEWPCYASSIVASFRDTFEDIIPLNVQLGLDPTFNPEQENILRKAMKTFLGRALKDRVIRCALERSSKDLPANEDEVAVRLLSATTNVQIDDIVMPGFVFIARYFDDAETVGLGYQNLFYDRDRPFPGFPYRHYLYVAINSDHLGGNSTYAYKNDVDYWAGVLAHEFLHNLGYGHPTGYSGSFIYEYGNCVRTNGIGAAPLEGELEDKPVWKGL